MRALPLETAVSKGHPVHGEDSFASDPALADDAKLREAAKLIFDACPDYGLAELLAHELSASSEGSDFPQVRLALHRIAVELFTLHDADVK